LSYQQKSREKTKYNKNNNVKNFLTHKLKKTFQVFQKYFYTFCVQNIYYMAGPHLQIFLAVLINKAALLVKA